jgi:hypothetical protein
MQKAALHVFPQGYTAFMRHVLNVTDEERQQRREQVLGTTLKDFRCVQPVSPRAGCIPFKHPKDVRASVKLSECPKTCHRVEAPP